MFELYIDSVKIQAFDTIPELLAHLESMLDDGDVLDFGHIEIFNEG